MFKRIGIYLKEMYPLTSAISGPILTFIFFIGLCQMLNLNLQLTPHLIIAAISLMFFILMIRVMDEFKDYHDDLINFPHRPLPSGRVKKDDLKILLFCLYALTLLMNALYPFMLLGTIVIFLYSGLMYKWFFMEKKMRQNLPLAFITHHPVVLFYFLYIIFAFYESFSLKVFPFQESLSLIPLGLCFTNWEFSRKIRSPEKEDSYTSYSKIWGPRRTTLICLVLLTLLLADTLYYFHQVNSSLNYILLYMVLFLFYTIPYLQFLLDPHQEIALKKSAEKLSLLCFTSIIFDFVLKKTYTSIVTVVLIHWMNPWIV